MSRRRESAKEFIRLQFELERDENPRLYDDLVRFNKGVKRVARLRTLAQDGLLVQCMPAGTFPRSEGSGYQQTNSHDDAQSRPQGRASILNQVFEDPIME